MSIFCSKVKCKQINPLNVLNVWRPFWLTDNPEKAASELSTLVDIFPERMGESP